MKNDKRAWIDIPHSLYVESDFVPTYRWKSCAEYDDIK